MLVAIGALLLIGLLFGYRIYILESDSMSPKYPKGSIVVLDSKARLADIGQDDVIGIMVGNSLVFHRVIGVPSSTEQNNDENANAGGWQLAGDRDPEKWTDVEITNGNLLGKLTLSIPRLGAVNRLFVHRAWIGWGDSWLDYCRSVDTLEQGFQRGTKSKIARMS